MEVEFDLRKSVPENAKSYYERSKKLKDKIPGLRKAIEETKRKMEAGPVDSTGQQPKMRKRELRRWFEKFRWFTSSDGLLVLGGRDATTNEVLIKKHLEPNDLVFHADAPGAPFFVVKNPQGVTVPEGTRGEAAAAAASYSRLWSGGLAAADVYEVDPNQVSKSPPAGEYLTKGAFMVYGQKRWHRGVELKVAVGVTNEGAVVGGPATPISAIAKRHVMILPGDVKQGELAKEIKRRLGEADLDLIQRFLPPGGGRLM